MDNRHPEPEEYELAIAADVRRFWIGVSRGSFIAGIILGFAGAIAIIAVMAVG